MAGKPWTEEAKARWRERAKRIAQERGSSSNVSSGDGNHGDGRSGTSASGASASGGGGHSSGREGVNVSRGTQNKDTGTRAGKPVVDLPKIKAALPGFLFRWNRFLNFIAGIFSSPKFFKKEFYLEPLTKEQAQGDAEFIAPWAESILPRWIQEHPFLAFAGILFIQPFFDLRWRDKPKKKEGEEKNNGEQSIGATEEEKAKAQ